VAEGGDLCVSFLTGSRAGADDNFVLLFFLFFGFAVVGFGELDTFTVELLRLEALDFLGHTGVVEGETLLPLQSGCCTP
jgi:hypothetical protein